MNDMMINNYSFDKPLTSDNSGYSKWGIGERGGKKYFVKEFLSPVYPVDPAAYSEVKMREKIGYCETFEKERTRFYRAIREAADGNLVQIEQFFRVGSKYYVSTVAITDRFLPIEEVVGSMFLERLRLCCSVAHALARIHEKGIVHSDIKPDNVIVVQKNHLKGYLIDFDCGFFEENRPKLGEELNGDMVYLSPEAYLHIAGEESNLSRKMDIFALGLLLCQYLTGKLPDFDKNEYQYAYESVLDDHPIEVKQVVNEECASLITRMLLKDPAARPDANEVFEKLEKLLLTMLRRTAPEVKKVAPKAETSKTATTNAQGAGDFFQTAGDL